MVLKRFLSWCGNAFNYSLNQDLSGFYCNQRLPRAIAQSAVPLGQSLRCCYTTTLIWAGVSKLWGFASKHWLLLGEKVWSRGHSKSRSKHSWLSCWKSLKRLKIEDISRLSRIQKSLTDEFCRSDHNHHVFVLYDGIDIMIRPLAKIQNTPPQPSPY